MAAPVTLTDKDSALAAMVEWGTKIKQWTADNTIPGKDGKFEYKSNVKPQPECPLACASADIRADKDVLVAALKHGNTTALRFVSDELKGDKVILLDALARDANVLYCAPFEIKNDREFMLSAVAVNGKALHGASDTIKNDEEVVRTAIRQNKAAVHFASDELKEALGYHRGLFMALSNGTSTWEPNPPAP